MGTILLRRNTTCVPALQARRACLYQERGGHILDVNPHYVLPVVVVLGLILRQLVTWFFWKRPAVDPRAEGQPEVMDGVRAVKKRDWPRLVALYEDRSPSDRYHFLRGLGQLSKLDAPLPPNPTGSLAIISAGLCVGWAWRHRGGGLGASVSDRGALNMLRSLQQAEALLEAGGTRADSSACALRIRIAQGLDGSRGALQRALNDAEALTERNIFVPFNHIMFVAPKWHGSLEEMFEVADHYAAASNNPAWVALPALAHAEAWLFRADMNDDAADRVRATEYYQRSPEFGALLEALDDKFWSARTKGGTTSHAELQLAHNLLAYLFYRRKEWSRLARHLDSIGKDLSAIPWGYAGITESGIDFVRTQAHLPPL